ncbi:MAG: glycoside hydrolase family 31 protein [Spirochaetales bacterium]|nr:glycoside hydrolase family 31 protein [Spirochaetales bacterium]
MKKTFLFLSLLFLILLSGCTNQTVTENQESESPAIVKVAEKDKILSADNFFGKKKGWQSLGSVETYERLGNGINFSIDGEKQVRLSFLTPSLFRVRFSRNNNYSRDDSYAVIAREDQKVNYSVADEKGKIILTTSEISLEIEKNAFRIAVYKDGAPVCEDDKTGIAWNDTWITVSKRKKDGARFYGFGEKTGPLNKAGTAMTNWNTDAYGYWEKTDPIYISVPFFIETGGAVPYGIFFDNTYQAFFDMGKDDDRRYSFGAVNGEMDYYFIYGQTVKKIISEYTRLTGRINLPPKWALGYQQCRYSYYPASRVNEIADNFRVRRIPCDAIYLDIDFMDANRSFTWNKSYFPDVKNFLANLENRGFKIITILDPAIKQEPGYSVYDTGLAGDHFCRMPDGELAVGRVWPGICVFPDFTRPETRKWWGDLYSGLLEIGIDGFWNDMNEPAVFDTPTKTMPLDALHFDYGNRSPHLKIHNVYGQEMIRATSEGLNRLRPGMRNFVLSRSGYAGLQRYAANWTGDNTAHWTHLKMNIPMVLNLGLSGIAMSGADIGGFINSPGQELFARWMELGAFIPVYRGHTEKGTRDQEPWAFGTEVEDISRKYIELRYKFIQALYDLSYEACLTGLPVIRPLFLEFPDDGKTYELEDQYMFGDSVLVAPVVNSGQLERDVYLPAGSDWYDFWTNERYTGGKTVTYNTPLDVMPVFIRSGAVLPLEEVVQYIGENNDTVLTFSVYAGSDGKHDLYFDDYLTTDYIKGVYDRIRISYTGGKSRASIRFEYELNGYGESIRKKYYLVKLVGAEETAMVSIGGIALKNARDERRLQRTAGNGFCYDAAYKTLIIKVMEITDKLEIDIR